ncbi:right-handed parallel beta-helix repeat-containing protein [Nocardioides marmoribigeumensis]|uniref:Parallel beta-helix repeat protein n=1 Tax=Nocardioides marmoribigeumensis TaxID=433649 RepID=A0ABU2BT52_9ACTN|nr:right-handed parallel beta-helix repeat-containing protein [Nocardioides marmoribigeumensis]MDR7361818.1 parallel beta-helix repeat protein [Nocardioides marmoribigeumensis]
MWSPRGIKYVAGFVLLLMMVPGAFLVSSALNRQDEHATAADDAPAVGCTRLVERLVSALGAFTRQFDGLSGMDARQVPPMPSMRQLRTEAGSFAEALDQGDCRASQARRAVVAWRDDAEASGPLAEAVRTALAANVLDVVSGTTRPVLHRLAKGQDLAAALSRLPSGATLVLPPGTFALDRPVAVVQDLTVRGAGPGRTTITSTAPGAAVLLASQVSLRIAGVGLRHRGGGTASVIVLRAGRATLDRVRITGATREGSAGAGSRAMLTGGSGIVLAGGQRIALSRSTLSDNAVGGLLVATGVPTVRAATFHDNTACGVCFLGRSAGRLTRNVMTRNGSGLLLGDRSAPVLADNRILRNKQAGLVIEGTAHPVLRRNVITDNGNIGVAVYSSGSPVIVANTITGHRQAGVLLDVTRRATPRVEDNVLRDNGSAGLVFMGSSRGAASGNTCSGARFGLVLDGSAAPVLRRNDCALQDQRVQRPPS